jgi:type III secretion protein U
MRESGEKTEPPSPKKIRDARAKGQVARSQEVVTTFSLMAVVAYIWATWNSTLGALIRIMDEIAMLERGDFRVNAYKALSVTFSESVGILLPVLGVTLFAGFAANYLQTGSVFSIEAVMPKLDKVSPGAGFKRIFSMKQLVDVLKSVVKIVFLSILLYFVIRDAIGAYVVSLRCGLPCFANATTYVLGQIFLCSALAFLIVAGFDFIYQRHSYTKSLMMSKDEVKREYKESEGDPHIKGHRKQLAHELLMSDSVDRARKGTAVVINPTHFAVVMRYEAEEMPLPVVTVKGRNNHAHLIRAEAERAGVPVFRNVRLAQALYATTEIDEYVPEELFDAVAEVLAWVAKNRALLYAGPLEHGVIDMDAGDHRVARSTAEAAPFAVFPD